ncbi:hypothetical protein AB5J49_06270 [Streptomyces sp. R28]|uniref:Uncharacterized protein n=1 Tax=Streptomyces sp. R28 TaxID=3238628 RepID=A0AB39PVH0_9ACTN
MPRSVRRAAFGAVSEWFQGAGGAGAVCEFVYDDASPQKPVVTSPDYPEDQLQDGVGVYGTFTMDSPSDTAPACP